MRVLTIKWGVSRGAATQGYTTCSLRENGARKAYCNGGGYDMRGTVFGEWLAANYRERLIASHVQSMYGAAVRDGELHVDGSCGFSCMSDLAEAIGLTVRLVDGGRNLDTIIVTEKEPT